jgi:hypothetical protein
MSFDLVNFTITPLASANVNVPRATVSGQAVDSTTGALLQDFTGANAVQFPLVLASLTGAERLELLNMIVVWLLNKRFPNLGG